jgi:hypothetical protein
MAEGLDERTFPPSWSPRLSGEEGGRGQRKPAGPPSLIPIDDVHFPRFRYPTKEEEPSGDTKGLAFLGVEFPDCSIRRL